VKAVTVRSRLDARPVSPVADAVERDDVVAGEPVLAARTPAAEQAVE